MPLEIPSLNAEVLGHIGFLPITNTMVNAWVAILIFLVLGLTLKRSIKLRPGKLQNACEYFLEIVLGYFDQVTGDRAKTMRFLPIAGSVFFFILLSNWLGIIPGTSSIFIGNAPLLRSANTDLNLTIAMALVSVIVSHFMGFASVGFFTHINKFIQIGPLIKSFRHGPIAVLTAIIQFGVGLMEIVSELAKVVSLSLRLFGNVFAGEVLMTVLSSLFSLLLPTPFMLLELLVGVIQAGVFGVLTMVYMTVASEQPHEAGH